MNTMPPANTHFIDCEIAGYKHRPIDAQAVVKGLEEGEQLFLEREPSNKYDPFAVKVIAADPDRTFLGYIPKRYSERVSMALVNDETVSTFSRGSDKIRVELHGHVPG